MRVVIGQGSCGIATGAKKTAAEFEKQIAEKNISNVTLGVTGCVGTCYPVSYTHLEDLLQVKQLEKILERFGIRNFSDPVPDGRAAA